MKRLIAAAAFLASGCAMHADLLGNDFVTVANAPPPAEAVGRWSGSMGPYLATLQIAADGSGAMCWSWNGKDVLNRMKFDGKQLRVQDGTRMDITEVTAAQLKVYTPYFAGASYQFVRDDKLANASPYCAKNI